MHTIYPPVAEAYFLAVHYLSPAGSGTTPIQAAAALCAVLVTLLLLYGLPKAGPGPQARGAVGVVPHGGLGGGQQRARGRAGRGLHRGRADPAGPARAAGSSAGRLRRSRVAGGALLALAIWTKVTPVLIAPAVLRRRRPLAVISAGITATVIVYLPHVLAVGSGVIGFLPGYLQQEGYANGTRFLLLGMLVPGKWGFARRLRGPGHGRPGRPAAR